MTSKVALKKQEQMTKLTAYEAPGSASRRMLMNTVKEMFESGKIVRFDQAERLMKSLRDNKMKDFDKRFSKIEAATATKVENNANPNHHLWMMRFW